MQIHINLRAILIERGLKQKDVAELLGLDCQDRVSHWETGRSYPSVRNLLRLCELYKVELVEIYSIKATNYR